MPSSIGYFAMHTPDAVRAKDFYQRVLGWRYADDDHVEGSSPAGGIAGGAPAPRIDAYLTVDDAEETVRRVRELGGQAPDPVRSPSGWSAECTDDQGGGFAIWQPAPAYAGDGPVKPQEGDLHYFVVPVADDAKAQRFYGALFGWEFTAGSHPHGWNIVDIEPPGGLFGAGAPAAIAVYFQVADIDAALERVRAAGGTAGQREPNQAGWHAQCRDDQGLEFGLSALRNT